MLPEVIVYYTNHLGRWNHDKMLLEEQHLIFLSVFFEIYILFFPIPFIKDIKVCTAFIVIMCVSESFREKGLFINVP